MFLVYTTYIFSVFSIEYFLMNCWKSGTLNKISFHVSYPNATKFSNITYIDGHSVHQK